MLKVISCIAVDHDPVFLAAAIVICVLGAHLTTGLFGRARRTTGLQWLNWIALTGIIGGCSIWTTHFVAMMGYSMSISAGYEPVGTLLSLVTAIAVTMLGFGIASGAERGLLVEAGGVVVGLGIVLMHYLGMSAYQVQGTLIWEPAYVLLSVVLGAAFGALATRFSSWPNSVLCKYLGSAGLIVAILCTHFTGMTAVTVVASQSAAMPADHLPEGMLLLVLVVVTIVFLALGSFTYAIDLYTSKAAVERYRQQSLHDALTGLPNRVAFQEHLARLCDVQQDRPSQITLLSFDLDRFKEINDVHGHAAGDHVLRTVGERLQKTFRAGEFIGRVGGDEFVAIVAHSSRRNDANALAQLLVVEIGKPIEWSGQILIVGSSVGVAQSTDEDVNMDGVLARADVAMYRAKSRGTNNVCFYDISMDQQARERNALAMDMRSGLNLQQFELYYQQQNDVQSGDVTGFEVLLRWNHPQRGQVSPNDFIPIAEKTGFILELGDWVLMEACREAASWINPLRIAVNVAPRQLANVGFPNRVQEILIQTGLAAHRLELEITESGIIADQQHALHIIRKLKALGVKIAMDDYGTGYSSLSTLQLFPFDKIKIDRSFIKGLEVDRQSAAIVRSTIILAASLDIPVLAEGVETADHLRFLATEGCQQAQGYYYAKPCPLADIVAIINQKPQSSVHVPIVADDGGEELLRASA